MSTPAYVRRMRRHIGHDPLYLPVVAAIVRDDAGGVLMTQRADDALWVLPGGIADEGEPPARAVAREVLEETGLVVEPTRLAAALGGADCRHVYPNGDRIEFTALVFECHVTGGRLAASDETTAARFVPPAEAKRLSSWPWLPSALLDPDESRAAYFTR